MYHLGSYTLKEWADRFPDMISQDERMPPGGMLGVFANESTIKALISRVELGRDGCLELAVKNTKNHFVVGGGQLEIKKFVELCRQDGITVFPLPVVRAFHTSMYQIKFKHFDSKTLTGNSVKYISSISGTKLGKKAVNKR